MKHILTLAALLALSGCSTYGPGEDMYGQQLRVKTLPVLEAMHSYMDDTARVPPNLKVLVPKYLDALPTEPVVVYDFKTSTLYFQYQQKDHNGSTVTCHALVGQLQWVCI